jgi:hypothetical protein
MRRLMLLVAAVGLLSLASASAFADETIVGPTVYTPSTTTVVTPEPVAPVGWYVGRPYWGGYTTYYPGYAPGYYSYPGYVYPGPVVPYRPYVYPWRPYRFGRVWW